MGTKGLDSGVTAARKAAELEAKKAAEANTTAKVIADLKISDAKMILAKIQKEAAAKASAIKEKALKKKEAV